MVAWPKAKLLKKGVGHGFDFYRFAPDRTSVVGRSFVSRPAGVTRSLRGGVVAHFLIDALKGPVGLGDIGTMFPAEDEF